MNSSPSPLRHSTRRPPQISIERLAATAIGRTADRLYGLAVLSDSITLSAANPAELAELLPERALLAIVQGRADDLGVVALCPSLIASLIEMQAIGRVSARAVRPRKPTRTDAAISADFVNALLRELQGAEHTGEELPDFASFSYVSFLDDIRPLLLMLEEGPLSTLTCQFRIGANGQRKGELVVALPRKSAFDSDLPGLGLIGHDIDFMSNSSDSSDTSEADTPFSTDFGADGDSAATPARQDLFHAVQGAPLPLVGVLCRRPMTLRALRALSPGDVISLPGSALDQARLETPSGQPLAMGKLGEAEGQYAIRLRAASASAAPALTSPQPTGFAAPFPHDSEGSSDLSPAIDFETTDIAHDLPDEINFNQPDDFRAAPLPVLDTSEDESGGVMDLSDLARFG